MSKIGKKWSHEPFLIKRFDHSVEVYGYVNGPFGIDYRATVERWILSHLPTGLRIGTGFRNLRIATKCAERIAPRHDFERFKEIKGRRKNKKVVETIRIINRFETK